MADDKPSGGDPMQLLLLVLGGFVVLVILWFMSGAYKDTDLRGIFLAPPPPIDSGDAYGPQVGNPNPNYTNTNSQQ